MPIFPVTESTLSSFHLGQHLQHHYRLSADTTCSLFRTGMNHLYTVAGQSGNFVFRVYTKDWRTKIEIDEELRLLILLKESGISVSFPVGDKRGEYIHEFDAPEGKRFGVLFSFAGGRKFSSLSTDTCCEIGVVMAKIHKAVEKLELKRVHYDTETLLIKPLGVIRSFFTKQSEEIAFIEQTIKHLAGMYEQVDVSRIRQGVLHLDIWFDNMHIDDDRQITIFDFDFCGNGWLCHDIAYFMLQLFNTNPNAADYENKVKSFLDGYESIVKISNEERRIIPFVCISVWFFYLGVQCDRFDTWSNIFLNEDHLKRFIGVIRRWMAYNKIAID